MAGEYNVNLPGVLVVFKALIKNSKEEILLVKRSNYVSWYSGKWENPGGRLKPGEDIATVLEREVLEEVNVAINFNKIPFWVETRMSIQDKNMPVIMLFYESTIKSGEIKLGEEHTEYKWVSIEEALKMQDVVPETIDALTTLTTTR